MISELLESNAFTVVVFGIFFVITWIVVTVRRPHGIPPGPTPLPLIGNILDLRGDLRQSLRRLQKEHGDVFSIYIGNKLTVVFSGYEAISEAFVKNGDIFSDRPRSIPYLPEYLRKAKGIVKENGDIWKSNRRFALSTMRDFGMGKNKMQMKIQEEVTFLIEAIESQKEEAFDMKELMFTVVSNVISSVCFGKRFDYDDKGFQHYQDIISQLISSATKRAMMEGIPILRYLPENMTGKKQDIEIHEQFYGFVKQRVDESLESYDENNIRSIVDAYIKQENLGPGNFSSKNIYDMDLSKIVSELFGAGTETTGSFLLWALLYFLHYPDIQERVSAQVTDTVEAGRLPGVQDRQNMPFLEATIMEVLRLSVGAWGFPHAARDDTRFRDYVIPKGAMAMINFDSIMNNENLWTKAQDFTPERFLNNGSLKAFDYFIPFGLGKRVCLGGSLARMELTVVLAALTRHFKFLPAEGEKPAPLKSKLSGGSFVPPRYLIRAIKRS